MSIDWGGRYIAGAGLEGTIPTIYRVYNKDLVESESTESSSNESSFIEPTRTFTEDLLQGEELTIRVTLYDGEQLTGHFKLAGLDDKIGLMNCWGG